MLAKKAAMKAKKAKRVVSATFDRALIIKKPWVDLILNGAKIWEIRGAPTSCRGPVFLAASGKKALVGRVTIVDCFEISHDELPGFVTQHCIADCSLVRYARVFAWVLEGAERFEAPREYIHPRGAITWVRLPHVRLTPSDQQVC